MFDTEVDFTDQQKQHILENPEILEDLLFWFSCNLSEGWWSQGNCDFMMGLNEKEQKLEFQEVAEEVSLEIIAIDWNFEKLTLF